MVRYVPIQGWGEPSRGHHWVACDHKCGLSYTCRCSNLFMYNARRSVLARSHDFGCSVYIRYSTFIHSILLLYCIVHVPSHVSGSCVVTVWSLCRGRVCSSGHSLEMVNQLSEGKWQMFLKMKKIGASDGYIL